MALRRELLRCFDERRPDSRYFGALYRFQVAVNDEVAKLFQVGGRS